MLETRKDGIKFTSEALRQAATQLQTFSGQYESRQGHLVEQVAVWRGWSLHVFRSRPELQHCYHDLVCQSARVGCMLQHLIHCTQSWRNHQTELMCQSHMVLQHLISYGPG